MSALTVLVAAAPSLLLLAYFYLRDRFDREPLPHLLAAYLLGALAYFTALGLGVASDAWVSAEWLQTGGEGARLFEAFVLTGLFEELTKWVVLVGAIYHWREFDEPLDGLIYGVTVALGFATVENLVYLDSRGLAIAWQRAVFAVPAHALFGGAMGHYAGRAKFIDRHRPARLWLDRALCLGLPTTFHGAYDFALMHGLDWKIWITVSGLSLGFWIFVLRRVYRAQRASPYRPKTMPPPSAMRRGSKEG